MIYIIPLDKTIKPIQVSANFMPSVGAIDIQSDQSIQFIGTLPSGVYPFVYTKKPKGSHTWHGTAFDTPIIETSGRSHEIDDLVFGQTDVRVILISEEFLSRVLQKSGKTIALYFADNAYHIEEDDVDLFLDIHKRVLADEPFSVQEIDGLVLRILQKPAIDRAAPLQSYSLLHSAICLIQKHLKSPLLISELAAMLNVSSRTLELTFKKHLNISPKTYLQRLLLQVIETELRSRSTQEKSVSDVLEDYQIYNLSQFGASFKKLFDQSPSSVGQLHETENPFGWNEKIFSEFA